MSVNTYVLMNCVLQFPVTHLTTLFTDKVEGLVNKVEDIEEEFSNKLEQHKKAMTKSSHILLQSVTRLENKINLL